MTRGCIVLLALFAAVPGCRQSPYWSAQVQLMNAEKRALEDEIYNLEFEYEDALRELEALRRENERLRGGGSPGRSGSGSSRTVPRSNSEPLPPMIDEGTLIEPQIEIPGQPAPMNSSPSSNGPVPPRPPGGSSSGASGRSAPSSRSNAAKSGGSSARTSLTAQRPTAKENKQANGSSIAAGPPSLEPADPRVTHLFLNPLRTGGTSFDREPGDDGITVIVEPRNRDDQFVPLAGPISVVVLDPAKAADQNRIVARWDITANDAQELLQNTATTRGIVLKLTWPAEPPTVSRLQLHVRYITVDSRDLRAQREIFLNLPGQFSQQWTPRAGTAAETQMAAETDTTPAVVPSPQFVEADVASDGTEMVAATDTNSDGATSSDQAANGESAAQLLPPPAQTAKPEWRPYR